jgi:hypothetical protein
MPDLRKIATDAAYVAVGLGVLGFQRAQVRRRELQHQLETQGRRAQEQLVNLVGRATAA